MIILLFIVLSLSLSLHIYIYVYTYISIYLSWFTLDNAGGDGIKGKRVMGGGPSGENATQGICSGVSSLASVQAVEDPFKHQDTSHDRASFRERSIGHALAAEQERDREQHEVQLIVEEFMESVVNEEPVGDQEGLEAEVVALEEQQEQQQESVEHDVDMLNFCEDAEVIERLASQSNFQQASSSFQQRLRRGTRSNPNRFEEEMARELQTCDEEVLAEKQGRLDAMLVCVVSAEAFIVCVIFIRVNVVCVSTGSWSPMWCAFLKKERDS